MFSHLDWLLLLTGGRMLHEACSLLKSGWILVVGHDDTYWLEKGQEAFPLTKAEGNMLLAILKGKIAIFLMRKDASLWALPEEMRK